MCCVVFQQWLLAAVADDGGGEGGVGSRRMVDDRVALAADGKGGAGDCGLW